MEEEIFTIISEEFGNYAKTGSGILLVIISVSYICSIQMCIRDRCDIVCNALD